MTVINVLLIFYKLTGICLLEFVDQKTQEVKLFIYQGCKSHIYSSYFLKHLTLIHFSK